MGWLKPGATYIYEKADGITYARELGTTERFEIGRDYVVLETEEANLWKDIRKAAKSDSVLQEMLDRVKITYYLRKDNGQK